MKILNIGPLSNKQAAATGGVVVLFENWVKFCNIYCEQSFVIDSNKSNYKYKFYPVLKILFKFALNINKADVIFFHGTIKDYQWVAPVVVWYCKLKRKKVALRKFAGSFHAYYEGLKGFRKKIVDYELHNADILFWETNYLVNQFDNLIKENKSYWFTNAREKEDVSIDVRRHYSKNFVFLSRVEKEKGIDYLLEAFQMLGDDYHLDIFGPLNGLSPEYLERENCTYKGKAGNVIETLKKYDALCLPTYWKTEGYPGIIIESFNAGIPVLASKIGGIPELIEDGVNGYLLEPKSVSSIVDAIKKINESNIYKLRNNSAKSFEKYDSNNVNRRVYGLLKEL